MILAHVEEFFNSLLIPLLLVGSPGLGSASEAYTLIPRLMSCKKEGPCIVMSEPSRLVTMASLGS